MAVSNLQTNITNISSKLYVISNKLNDLLSEVVDDEYNFDVPQNYKIVEYIQANGSCWCNSGFIPCAETQIYGKFYMASQSSSYPTIFGARNSGYSLSWYSHNMTSGWGWTRNNATSTRTGQTVFQNTTVYLDSTENYKKMKFLDELQMEVGSITWDLGTGSRMQHPLYFFTLNGNGSVDTACYSSGYRIHYIKFYENGNLVREYCACLDANGTPCFYDTVTGTTFYNQGSGSFVAGPVHEKKYQKPYIELEYIQSSGSQYIDTLYKHNTSTTKFNMKVNITSTPNTYNALFGARTTHDSTDAYYLGITNNSNHTTYGCIGGTKKDTISGFNINLNTDYTIEIDPTNGITANGVLYNFRYSSAVTSPYNDFIFGFNTSNALNESVRMKLYHFKIYEGQTLVMDLIPVKRRADSVVCMYDNISKNYFENRGSGTFIAGPEKGDKPYKQLDYIESTGTQYIETNYTPNNNTKVQITVSDVKAISSVPNAVLFSASNTWDYNIFALTYQNQHNVNGYRYMLPGDVVFGNGTYTNKNTIEVYRGSVWFNNSSIRTDTATKTFGHVATLHFCGENRYNDNGYQHNNYKTHSFKIWENDILRFDFIPVKRKSDDVVCMYDLVSGQFYENAGTGTFIAGPEV